MEKLISKERKKYEIYKEGKLCIQLNFKKEEDSFSENSENENNNESDVDNTVKSDNYILYEIPFRINEYELIRKIHEEINHRNAEDS